MYQGSFNHSACKNSSFSIGFLLYFNILYTKIKFYLIDLRKSQDFNTTSDTGKCGISEEPFEIYTITGSINSTQWGDMTLTDNSYFCSNKYTYIELNSDSLGNKNIGTTQGNLQDDFGKQKIFISGIANLKGDIDILARGDDKINQLSVSVSSKALAKQNINKKVFQLFKTYKNNSDISTETAEFQLNSFSKTKNKNYYLYDYKGETLSSKLDFNGGTDNYINEGKYLKIGSGDGTGKIEIKGKHTVIVDNGNIYINSNLYNENDNTSLLVLVAKKGNDGNGGNIYIDPDVTNIDAVLIAEGSLISMDELSGNGKIWDVKNDPNNLRNQLLIYGSVFSSNNVGTSTIPYGADYYEKLPDNKMEDSSTNINIHDLGNLRTFNLNYGSGSLNENKLVPIHTSTTFKQNAWAGQCKWYNGEDCDSDLRKSDKHNPLIIEYNSKIQFINPYILQK
ncbi:MAG: hypothetical protein Q9M97_10310 [Candidatus Gracilibacteria bacterium]|nr:hypothetical protein [Candidatus Gracilibacteria bacterium]